MNASANAAAPAGLKVASAADDGRYWLDAQDDESAPEVGVTRATASQPSPGGQLELQATSSSDAALDELCERLAWWVHTRKLFGAPRGPVSLLGKLRTGTRALKSSGGPDAACSSLLQALYIAVLHEPADALDRQVFELHYLHRIANVKVAAAQLNIGRQHWYTLLRSFRRRIHATAVEIQWQNEVEIDRAARK